MTRLYIKLLPLGAFLFIHVLCSTIACETSTENTPGQYSWNKKGYLIFCLCMGRFGNQAEHFLGGLAFAKRIDRVLILPPWRTYKNIPFKDWFKLDVIAEYHDVIPAEDFMRYLAPEHWPSSERIGYCFSHDKNRECKMKEGNPFGPFWDGLGVDFNSTMTYSTSYQDTAAWKSRFPSDKYPVLALKGAPASFPMQRGDCNLQQYLQWSDYIQSEGNEYIQKNFPGEKFVGLHLRNGADWVNACGHVNGMAKFMASPQCIDPLSGEKVTKEICFPPLDEILRLTKDVILKTKAKVIYVATDKNPYIDELESYLKEEKVKVFHQDPWLPQLDLYILGQSDHFIGNCVSSFTSFVSRERTINGKPTSFWGYS